MAPRRSHLSFDAGASWQAAGRSAAPAVIGHALGILSAGPKELFDRQATLELSLLNDGMALVAATDAQLVEGANLALVGDELLQFGTAVQTGAARWRIGNLLRGRRGSDGAIAAHAAGEAFLLLDPATLLQLDIPLSRVGAALSASGIGPGETGVAATDTIPIEGRALRPPAPILLGASRRADGAIGIDWVRRSRIGWSWLDGVDVPLGEDRERYRLVLQGAGGQARQIEPDGPAYLYLPGDQAADGWAGTGTLTVSLVQIGTHATSVVVQASWTF